MGFKRATLRLTWPADSEFHGQEVECIRPTVGELTTVRMASDAQDFDQTFKTMAEALLSWNIDHPRTGEPLPANIEGLKTLDAVQFFTILNAWMEATTTVSPPLAERSNSTDMSLGEFDLTAALSESQPSLPTPDSKTESSEDIPATP